MTIASLLALCAFVAYVGIGIYAVRARYKSISSIIFLFFSLVLGLWALSYFEISSSPNGNNRLLWFCMAAAGWTLLPAALLHFSLSLKDEVRSGKPVFLLVYLPACLFIYRGMSDKIAAPANLVNEGFAWGDGPAHDPVWFWSFTAYFAAYVIASALLLFISANIRLPRNKVLYARLASLGALPVFALAVAADVAQPHMNLQLFPSISPIVLMPWFMLIRYAVSMPKPHSLSPLLAAHDIIHRMNDLLILADNEGKIAHVNCRVLDLFEYEEADLLGSHIGDLVADEEFVKKTFVKIRHKLFHGGEINLTCRMNNGNLIPITFTGFPVSDGNGQVVGVALVGSKAVPVPQGTEPGTAYGRNGEDSSGKEGFNAADEKFRSLVEQSLVGIFIVKDDKFMYVNPKMAEIFGYRQEELMGSIPVLDVVSQCDRKSVAEKIRMITSSEKKSLQFTFSGRQNDGGIIDVETYAAITDYNGEKAVIGSLHEITERKLMEEAIRHQAFHDSLTSLPNRILFNDRLVTAIAKAHRDKTKLAVMFMDLDRFKNINDTLGHTVGDMLLQSIAGLLRDCLRESDTVARLGGDEYTILLSQINDEEDALRVAQKILSAVNQRWVLDGHRLHLTTSIGISVYPNDGKEAETLIRKADTAMYHVKAMGGNAFRVFDPSLDAGNAEQARLESDLRVALENGELLICYQPQVDMTTKRVSGVEALLRWNHPELGLLQPKQFIHLAEKTGLIVPIGEWVLRMACLQAKVWDNSGFPSMHIAVNVSAVQLQQHDFVDVVENVLKKTSFTPDLLKLEITESVALQNLDAIVPKLTKLTDIGVRFAIDDFGMGYSSLNYLKRLPIQTIKIDRSFMNDLMRREEDASIVTAVIAMAKSLNLDTIAEGVETEEQMTFLNKCRCDKMQGFLFSHPLPAKDVEKLLL